ncbi:Breast carcinoma amplified sequence 3 [Mortierella hygrophila]|uniref:Breast carcinoma amplified sequence 3 n=1 Tax=Mortierella hygrophila TaxID=979708 RepID=A0A9P6F9B4_9FUNG|nr:Breast carcinoma amplified sequence 3 [Mortierella hygrophila]
MADQQQLQQGQAGVRAEPVFIRDPSALESLSSVLTGVSSYVANTLPTSFSMPTRGFNSPSSPAFPGNPSSPYYYPTAQGTSNPLLGGNQDSVCILTNGDVVHFSAFDWIDAGPMAKNRTSRRFCLLLGYADGMQIWDITHPDNIHEIFSARDPDNEVSLLKVLPSPRVPSGKFDLFEQYRPLLAVISNKRTDEGRTSHKKLEIYSLATHQVVMAPNFEVGPDYDISALDVNERELVVTMTAPGEGTRLFMLNQLTLQAMHAKPLALNDVAYPGVLALGTRLLAYVTTSESPSDSSDTKHGEESDGGGGYQDLAKGVAKEVFGGVKMLGKTIVKFSLWYIHSALIRMSPRLTNKRITSFLHVRRASASADHDRTSTHLPHRRRHDDNSPHKKEAIGTVIVRDITMSNMPIVAHFKPHDHPITGCKFSPSGRLLLTVSRHGNVFHIHEVRPAVNPGSRHVYKLARGITHASVEDIVFNEDETWVAVTTSRGTTHLYAINPFGGTPDVGAHMYTGVVNWTATAIEYPTSLNALCRIKQRHHVPDVILSSRYDLDGSTDLFAPGAGEKRRGSLRRQNSQDSMSSTGTGNSDTSQGYLSRLQQNYGSFNGGRQRAMIATHFLPSSTVFASDPGSVALSPGEFDGGIDGPFGPGSGGSGRRDNSTSSTAQNSSTLLMNRSKAPPVSTTARLQSTASQLWQTLSPPAAAVVQHAAHGLASLPGLVVETSRRGPVATVRSRTMSWTGANIQPNSPKHHPHLAGSRDTRGDGQSESGSTATSSKDNSVKDSDASLAVQQQLASQGSLVEPERGPSFADVYVFNPLGMLTLHRCWVSSVRTKKTYNGRAVETSDLLLAPEDVAEWTLNRSGDWAPVKRSLALPAGTKAAQQHTNKVKKSTPHTTSGHATSRWLAHAEISTYDNGMHSGWKGQYPLLNQTLAAQGSLATTVTLTQPQHLLWKSPQFSFQNYVGSVDEVHQDFIEGKATAVKTLNLRRGVAIVAGKDPRSTADASRDLQGANRPWISGIAVAADGRGVRGHGRVESHDGDAEDLSENLSSAMKSYLQTHSSSPINQSRMSPSIGSVSPSSFRAATLSFEDAYLISLGNASGSPKPTFFGSMGQPAQYTHQTFLSTPPAEQVSKSRNGSLANASPSLSATVAPMTGFTNTPSSSTSPMVSSFGDSSSPLNGTTSGSSAPKHHLKSGFVPSSRSSPHHAQTNSQGHTPTQNPVSMNNSLGKTNHLEAPINSMAQSTMMMFSPDGDNEVDMPGSASVFIGHDRGHVGGGSKRSSQGLSNKRGGNQGPQESTLPHGGVFHLDDDEDFFGGLDDMNGHNGHHNGLTNGRYDGAVGKGRTNLSEFLEQDEDDYDDGSLV